MSDMTETAHKFLARMRDYGDVASRCEAADWIEAAIAREAEFARKLQISQTMLTTYQTANANNLALQVSANAELTAAIEREAALLVALRYYSEGTGDMGEVARNSIRDAI